MATTFVKGRGVKVEIAATFGTPVTVSAVTLASPGVATATAHSQTNGTCGVMSGLSGMVQLEGQAVRVANQATNTFELQGLNTTNYSAFTGSAVFTPAATWLTLAESTNYAIGGGDAEKLNSTALIDVVKKEENGLLAPQSLQLGTLATTFPTTAMAKVEAAAQGGTPLLVRITLQDGSVRLCYGEPSLPGETVGQGAIGTGGLTFTAKGFVLKLAA